MLEGHFLDFYDFNKPIWQLTNYLPSTYLLFAAWNIPIWVAKLVTPATVTVPRFIVYMWYKLLPTLAYFAAAYPIYRIALHLGLGSTKSRLCAYAWLTTPIAFFSQFIFGQYDALTVLITVLGLYYYLRGDLTRFALLFGIATTFKYFPVFVFVPLLFLKTKDLKGIAVAAGLFLLPLIVEVAPFVRSPAFMSDVVGFQATSTISGFAISNGFVSVRFFFVAWLFVCGWAYYTEPATESDTPKWALFFANIVAFLLFGISMFSPQWLLFATPFWVISTFMNKKMDALLVLDLLTMMVFTIFTVNVWAGQVDQQLFGLGILKRWAEPVLGAAIPMRDMFLIKDTSLLYSILSGIFLIHAVFKHPRYSSDGPSLTATPSRALLRTRFVAGTAFFVLPASLSLLLAFYTPAAFFRVDASNSVPIGPITEGRYVAQVFTADRAEITSISFKAGTYTRINHSQVALTLMDVESGATLFSAPVDVPMLKDNAYYAVELPDLRVQAGSRYAISFVATGTGPADYITVYRTVDDDTKSTHYAIVDGKRQPYDLAVIVSGK